jgi:Ion channel
MIHATGMIIMADWLVRQRAKLNQQLGLASYSLVLMMIFMIIIILHLSHAFIWSAFYDWRGLFPDYETSLYFSLTSYATIGYGDVVLPRSWRLLGTIEGVSGVLLCGLSTAFLFAIINIFLRQRISEQGKKFPNVFPIPTAVLDQHEKHLGQP